MFKTLQFYKILFFLFDHQEEKTQVQQSQKGLPQLFKNKHSLRAADPPSRELGEPGGPPTPGAWAGQAQTSGLTWGRGLDAHGPLSRHPASSPAALFPEARTWTEVSSPRHVPESGVPLSCPVPLHCSSPSGVQRAKQRRPSWPGP